MQAWTSYKPEQLRITIDGVTTEERTIIFAVANTPQYGAGVKIAPNADPFDGRLEVARLAPMSILRVTFMAPRVFRGTLPESDYYRRTSAVDLLVERERAGVITVDGEPIEEDAVLRYSIKPGALKVWVPKPG